MPFTTTTITIRPAGTADAARDDTDGCTVPPIVRAHTNCQLPEQVLRYLPSRQIAVPIASGTRGAVVGTDLSGFTGRSGGVNTIGRRQEVRQMSERTELLPTDIGPDGPRLGVPVKNRAPQSDSVGIGCPTGRLAISGSGVAA